MSKITIDYQEYELVEFLGEKVDDQKRPVLFALKPIELVEPKEKRTIYLVNFYKRSTAKNLVDKEYDFTEAEAQAVSKCLKAVLEYVNMPIESFSSSGKPEPSSDYDEPNYINLADKARNLIQGGGR